jgi:hypothetical protein
MIRVGAPVACQAAIVPFSTNCSDTAMLEVVQGIAGAKDGGRCQPDARGVLTAGS